MAVLNPQVPEDIFDYPRGWFAVALSPQISSDAPIELRYFGRKLAAYRKADGTPVVMDATCPHMGANLAKGGRVEADGLRCPFHDWRFGPNGKCNDIPYAKLIPPKAMVRTYPTRDINGVVYVWHDQEEGEPEYELPDLAEWNDKAWSHWKPVQKLIATHPREVIDNIADKGHFGPVHGQIVEHWKNTFDGHKAVQIQGGGHKTLATSDTKLHTEATYHGPGYLLTRMTGWYDAWMLVVHTPIDKNNLSMWSGLMVKNINGMPQAEFEAAADGYEEAGVGALLQDVSIWENKEPSPRPLLCDGDGPIIRARIWYSQFYRPREKAATVAAE
jgi:3-ketosteroid 9alpha-monooxygenase subunit A